MTKFKYIPHPFLKLIEIEVYVEQRHKCCNCGKSIDLRIDRPDHIVPQTKMNVRIYGEELIQSKENCQIPCFHCHQNKAVWSKPKQKALIEKWKPFSRSKIKSLT